MVVLLQVAPETATLLRSGPDAPRNARFEQVSEPQQLLDELEAEPARWDTVVLGVEVDEPVRITQRVHALDRDISVLILCHEEQREKLARELRFAPFIAEGVGCLAITEGAALATHLADAVDRARKRRSMRATLAAVNVRMPVLARIQPEAAQYLERLFHQAPIGVAFLDVQGLVLAWNRRAGEILGASEHQALGTSLEGYFPERTAQQLAQLIARAGSRDEPPPEILERPTHDGDKQFVEARTSAVRASTGQPGVLVLLQDVTERVLAERERRRAAERQHLLAEAGAVLGSSLDYEATLQTVAELAVATIADWCLIDLAEENRPIRRVAVAQADPAKEELARQARRFSPDLRSDKAPVRVFENRQPVLVPTVSEGWLNGYARSTEHLEVLRKVGVRSLMIVPLIARGRTIGVLWFVTAESGRQYRPDDLALGEELAHRAALAIDNARLYRDLQQALRTRDEFLASTAHDLKTPLTTIKGLTQLLQRQTARQQRDQGGRLANRLERIDAATTKMRGLIDELLDVARLQLGQPLQLERKPVDLVALARQALAEHQQAAERHELRLEAKVPELVGQWDETRLGRVLENLLGNALKYSPEGGQVLVRLWREGDWAVLQVQDQGLGIPAQDLPRIFERFWRGQNVEGRIHGSGLGLAGAKTILEHHGGSIMVDSQEGEGSTFTLRLPLAAETADGPDSDC